MSDPFQDTPPAFEGEEDPAADFLASQQNQLADLEDGDDFGFSSNTDTGAANSNVADSQFDAFGDEPAAAPQESVSAMDDFGTLSTNENETPLDFNSEPPQQNGFAESSPYSAISSMDRLAIEPEKIKKWREEQKQLLEEKDASEEENINEMRAAAAKELEDWYKHRDEQLEKTKSTNRAAEEAYVKEIEDKEPGSEFERICKLCDFNPKNSKNTRDVSRFRSILLQLKQGGLIRNVQ